MNEERWSKLDLSVKMGNIGSEFFRMTNFKEKNNLEGAKNSLIRLLELIDLTVKDKNLKNRLLEILRLREIICDIYLDNKYYNVSSKNLKKYFISFSLKV